MRSTMCFPNPDALGRARALKERFSPNGFDGESWGTEEAHGEEGTGKAERKVGGGMGPARKDWRLDGGMGGEEEAEVVSKMSLGLFMMFSMCPAMDECYCPRSMATRLQRLATDPSSPRAARQQPQLT